MGGQMVRVSVGDQQRMVSERTARIIRWLIDRSERLSQPDQVRLAIHCTRRSVKGEITEMENVPALLS